MKFTNYLLYVLFSLGLLQISCSDGTTAEAPTEKTEEIEQSGNTEYAETIDWLLKQSNDYSGVLNPRQTWKLTHDDYQIKETYFWDGKPSATIEFDMRNIGKAKIEQRFTNSVALYPKNGNAKHFTVKRFEEGKVEEITGDYFNWMVVPDQKGEVLAKMNEVLGIIGQ